MRVVVVVVVVIVVALTVVVAAVDLRGETSSGGWQRCMDRQWIRSDATQNTHDGAFHCNEGPLFRRARHLLREAVEASARLGDVAASESGGGVTQNRALRLECSASVVGVELVPFGGASDNVQPLVVARG